MTQIPAERQTTRIAGVLLHPTSLPGRFGIGDFGDELLAFLEWAQSAGVRMWQVLPLNPPGYGNSPYGCLSSYAGNPLLISPDRLGLEDEGGSAADGLRTRPTSVDFNAVAAYKTALLRRSWAQFDAGASDEDRQTLAAFERD